MLGWARYLPFARASFAEGNRRVIASHKLNSSGKTDAKWVFFSSCTRAIGRGVVGIPGPLSVIKRFNFASGADAQFVSIPTSFETTSLFVA